MLILSAGQHAGARTQKVWFKVCPVLLASSAALLLVVSVR
jgi:hypothetical protein